MIPIDRSRLILHIEEFVYYSGDERIFRQLAFHTVESVFPGIVEEKHGVVFEIMLIIEPGHPSGRILPLERERPVAEEVSFDIHLFAATGVIAAAHRDQSLHPVLEIGGVFFPMATVLARIPSLASELGVHHESQFSFKREFPGITSSEINSPGAIKSIQCIFVVFACPAIEPPVVGEHTVGYMAFDGEHFLASPHVGIVEDADAYLRDRTCIPSLCQCARRKVLI